MIHLDALLLPATPAHAAALAAIHTASFPPRERWGPDAMALQLGLPGAFGLIHLGGGMVLARTAADEAEILTIAVMPERRRDGLGGTLLRAAMAHAATQNAQTMFLEVAVTNAGACALYLRTGFSEVGRRTNYYPDGGDALVMRADLSGFQPGQPRHPHPGPLPGGEGGETPPSPSPPGRGPG